MALRVGTQEHIHTFLGNTLRTFLGCMRLEGFVEIQVGKHLGMHYVSALLPDNEHNQIVCSEICASFLGGTPFGPRNHSYQPVRWLQMGTYVLDTRDTKNVWLFFPGLVDIKEYSWLSEVVTISA
jgi:hypothetical protein